MLNKNAIERAWQLYEFYSNKKRRSQFRIKPSDDESARVAFIMLRVNPDLKKHEFETYVQLLPDAPGAGDPRNKNQEYEREKIRELKPYFGTSDNQYYLNRNQGNEPVEDAGPEIPKDQQWTPINTNSANFVWLNKVAHLFELPGAVKEENVPFIQKIKEMRDAQPQEQPEQKGSGMNWLDYAQMGLDVSGIFEPTPFSDSLNAGISVLRAVAEPKNAGSHLVNAGISLASMVPYVGDFAKVYKAYGKSGSAIEHLGRLKNNRSRMGRTASILYEALGGKAMEHAGGSIAKEEAVASRAASAIQGSGGMASAGGASASSGGLGGLGSVLNGLGGLGGGGAAGGGAGGGGLGGILGGGAAGGGGGASSVLSGLAGGLAKLTAVVGIVVVAMKALHGWAEKTAQKGREMLEGQRAGAMWSGQASSAMFSYDLSRLKREGQLGRYLAPATASLAKSQDTLEQSLQDYNSPYIRLGTNIQIVLNGMATGVIQIVESIDVVRMILEKIYSLYPTGIGYKNPIEFYQDNPNPIPQNPAKFQNDMKNNKPRGFV